jgi:hypothetical protein
MQKNTRRKMGEQVMMRDWKTTLFSEQPELCTKYVPPVDPIAITLWLIDKGDGYLAPNSYITAPARAFYYIMNPICPLLVVTHVPTEQLEQAAKIRRYYKAKLGTLLLKQGKLTDWQTSIYSLLCKGPLTPLGEKEIGGIVKLAHFYNEDKLIERIERKYPISMPNPLPGIMQWVGKHRFKLIDTMIVARKKGNTQKHYWFEVTGIDAKIHAARFRTPHNNPLNFFLEDAVKDNYLYVESPVLKYVDYHPPRLELVSWTPQQRK